MAGFKNIDEVLAEAKHTLEVARLGLEDFLHGDRDLRRSAGFRNTIVWGRSVTFVLQHLRTFTPDSFDAWYGPYQAEMRQRPGFKYLVEMRNQLEKEGRQGTLSRSMSGGYFDFDRIRAAMPSLNPPPEAASLFLGGPWGDAGWIVERADGTQENFYIDFPAELKEGTPKHTTVFTETIERSGAPVPPPSESIDQLLTEYLAYLARLVDAAQREFGHK